MAFINNSVTNNGGVPGAQAGPLANRPAVSFDGAVYIANDTGNEAIYQYSASLPGWVNLTGGGGGGVGTLQQVTTLGNITDRQMFSVKDTVVTGDAIIGVRGLDDTDTRRAQLFSNSGEDAGILQLGHKDGTVAQIKFNNGGGDINANLRTTGTDEDLAYVSELPFTGTWSANPTNLVNISALNILQATFQVIQSPGAANAAITLSLAVEATTVITSIMSSFDIDLPIIAGSPARIIGSGAAFRSTISPVAVVSNGTGGTDTATVSFIAPSVGVVSIFINAVYQ